MSDMFKGYFWGVAVTIIVRGIIDLTFPSSDMVEFKAEAIKRNAAEWVVDPATGSTTFKWKEVAEKP